MQVNVDVVRVIQVWDANTLTQTNTLVIRFAGTEVSLPCSEAQVMDAIREITNRKKAQAQVPAQPVEREFRYEEANVEEEPFVVEDSAEQPSVVAPTMFRVQAESSPAVVSEASPKKAVTRKALAPVSRPRAGGSDDARFGQG